MLNCWVTATNDIDLRVKRLDQLGEVGERSGETVDLVDDDHVDPAEFDFAEQPFQGRALKVAPGIGGVVVMLGQELPSLRSLTLYICLAGLPLRVEGIELLIEPVLGRFAGIDGAAQRSLRLSRHGRRLRPRIGMRAGQRTGDRSIWSR